MVCVGSVCVLVVSVGGVCICGEFWWCVLVVYVGGVCVYWYACVLVVSVGVLVM